MLKHLAEFSIIHSIWKNFNEVPKATLMSLILKKHQKLIVQISSRNSLEKLIKNISSGCSFQNIIDFSYKWLKWPKAIYHCLPNLGFLVTVHIYTPPPPPIHTAPIDTPLHTYNVYNSTNILYQCTF